MWSQWDQAFSIILTDIFFLVIFSQKNHWILISKKQADNNDRDCIKQFLLYK